jgi:signal transduction histidine kinase
MSSGNKLLESPHVKWLSILSDIFTIFGVSVATVVASSFFQNFTLFGFDMSEFSWAITFWFVYLILIITLGIKLFNVTVASFKGSKVSFFSNLALILFAISIVSTLTPYLSSFFGVLVNSRYMLELPAIVVTQDVDNIIIQKADDTYMFSGKVKFKDSVDPTKYIITIYSKSNYSSRYVYQEINRQDVSSSMNSSGYFVLPRVELKRNQLIDSYLVIYRKSDSGIRMFGSSLPNYVNQMPSPEIEEAGGFVFKLNEELFPQLDEKAN